MSLYAAIKKHYQDFTLDVELELGQETLALLGASGCGKSLTLKCLAGIIKPDSGRIVLDGVTLYDSEKRIDLPPQKRQIGYLFQNYALFPHMTVAQNIAMGLQKTTRPLSKEEKQAKVQQMLAHFQLEGVGQHKPNQLSGGQQQRTALARIFIGNPQILLLDEPFSALDHFLKSEMEYLLLQTIEDFDHSVIFVSHDRDEVFRLCGRAAIYRQGRIEVSDQVEQIFANPATVTAARLTGCKNIVPIRPDGPGRVWVPDWGVSLAVGQQEIGPEVAAIGIRAHALQKVAAPGPNRLAAKVKRVIEEPFETIVYLVPLTGLGEICYKIPKGSQPTVGQSLFLQVPSSAIYLLRQ